MTDRAYNVLFLCTGNSARSVIAEALLNRLGRGHFHAFSAGSRPRGELNPQAVRLLRGLGYDTGGMRSKSWDEFAAPGAPVFDFIFTVCDDAAGEECPIWPGHPMTAHWGIPDPAKAEGTAAQIGLAFAEAYRLLERRIELLVALPLASLDRLTLKGRLAEIGRIEGATARAKAAK